MSLVPPGELAAIIRQTQARLSAAAEPHRVFDALLPDVLRLGDSEYGFIGEVWRDEQSQPYLKIFTLTNIAWDEATRALVDRQRPHGLEFRRLDTLLGAARRRAAPLIANDAANDPRSGGTPPGHPPLRCFLALPLHFAGELVGMIGLANRPGGYDDAMIKAFEPLAHAVAGMIGAVRIDRERRRIEAALREAEHRYRATFEHAAVGITHTSLAGVLIDVNRHFCELVGHPREALIGQSYRRITHPEDIARQDDLGRAMLRGELPRYQIEKRYRRGDGTLVWAQVTSSVARDADGRPVHFIAMVEDVSERRRVEEALVAAQAAEQANAAKTEFLSRMSHELRTPLNAVQGFAQLLLLDGAQPLSAQQQSRVEHIRRAGDHLLAMINDVLDLSRIESGGMALRLEPLPVRPLVEEWLSLVQASAQPAGVTLALDPDHSPAGMTVQADKVRLRQVLMNLLSNAIKYNHRGGRVTVGWQRRGEPPFVRITVADTGPGLTAQQRAHLFEPFNRLGAERSGIEGTGIGLVITRRLAELMGGSVSVTSEVGAGCRFTVTLPAGGAADAVAADAAPASAPALPPPLQRTILYAEDNAMNVELVRQIVQLRPHWRLVVARNGGEALELAARTSPDLLLLDMHLGDMNGLALAGMLRERGVAAGAPRIALSADAMPERVRAAREAGFAAYVTKPIDVTQLVAQLDAHLGAHLGAAPEPHRS